MRMQSDPSCPSGIAMLNRAMYGRKDAAQCFDSYCERTMEKLDYNIGVFNPCLYKHPVKDVSVLRHDEDFATLSTRTQIAEFTEDLSKHLLVKHIGAGRIRHIATPTPWLQRLVINGDIKMTRVGGNDNCADWERNI